MAQCKFTSQRIRVLDGDCHVVRLNPGDIWENAELISIRDTFVFLFHNMGVTSFGVDLKGVKHLPSGFFGLLHDWHDRGAVVRLYAPGREITGMLWFRQFFRRLAEGTYIFDATIGCVPSETSAIHTDVEHHLVAAVETMCLQTHFKSNSQSLLV